MINVVAAESVFEHEEKKKRKRRRKLMLLKKWIKVNIKIVLATIIFISGIFLPVQADSNVTIDSVLLEQHNTGKELLAKADSIKLQDSLQESALVAQIEALQATDKNKREELQAKVDSLKKQQEKKDNRIKKEIDSLRNNIVGVPVLMFGDTLFYIYSKLGAFSPSERAERVQSKIESLLDGATFNSDLLEVFNGEESADLIHGDVILLSVTDRDAFWRNKSKEEVAKEFVLSINEKVIDYKERTGIRFILYRIAMLLLVISIFFFGVKYLNEFFAFCNKKIIEKGQSYIKGIRLKDYEFLSVNQEVKILAWLLKILKWVVISLIVYLSLPSVFSIFPATKGIATTLIGYVVDPAVSVFRDFIGFIPELITIAVIVIITRYIVRFLKFISTEVENEKLKLPGFYPDWSIPTFNLLKIIIYAFSFIFIFPYLPGSSSPIFQGVSVFFGLLISLGSSSAIGNIIAGLVITYMRAFKIGDRVKIGETTGDVIEKNMLVTRVRTIKNENITIPNSSIMNGNTVNYTSSAKDLGLILNTTVTIGYDAPWRKVHELLIAAALKTNLIKSEPIPFVLQTSLDDFYVSYQINAYTIEAAKTATIYSELYANIQDVFNEEGIEILSPHYRAERDGNGMAVPSQYLPKDYKSPNNKSIL